ncbi:unnamed protein product [Brassicogethes aeneus]|uniref:Rho GTPase-activating protein 7 n=1 Tax=Brassicogethes aeneus TaxID=1431903 RepID=A0A9P0BFZ8_BRAAE|nr:unnamed protein product [Brassicogethes aeneus]
MSNGDQYQDVLLFLEQTRDEISKVFEKGAPNNNSELQAVKCSDQEDLSIKKIIDEEYDNDIEQLDKIDFDYEILNEQLIDIELQISQLVAKNKENGDINDDFCSKDYNIYSIYNNLTETDILSSDSLISDCNVNDVCTQTSPSLSPSSTNLTWATECSSSPCLTSTSDSDLLDEDAHSTSSTDGRDHPINHQRSYKILSNKSSSAPILKKCPLKMTKHTRSQSDRHLAEIEAEEACKWLRATGFPQYAQMYEDMQFPIDITTAGQDHPLLEEDVLNSLFRRLKILNNCAHLHHQQRVTAHTDESEDECCALSDNWTYLAKTRRWSRTCKVLQPASEESKVTEPKEKDDVFEKPSTFTTRAASSRRAASTKFRRRGLLFSDRDSVHDSDRFSELKVCEVNHVSDSELTPTHLRRSRAKSFDKSETWSLPNAQTTTIWPKLTEAVPSSPESEEPLDITGPAMSNLSCSQLQVLRKLALLKLTAHIEKYCPSQRTGWSWELPKFIRKKKSPVYKDKHIFGVPLTVTFQKTGQIVPKNIEEALTWLQKNATDQVGIFRKPGVKSRIQVLRNTVETNHEIVNYNEHQHYDVADMVKQYFRELPDALLTNKFSETFILIFQHLPTSLRRESILCSLLLMPDEHIEVLEALLHFLLQISKEALVNQMNESNLAMCFAPSLFHYSQSCKQNLGSPHPRELAENKAGHECLLYFLKHYDSLFNIPKEFLAQCETKNAKVATLGDLGKEFGGYQEFLRECQENFLKEVRDKGRGFMSISGHNPKVDVSFKKVVDGIPLRLWKVCAEIEAPPSEVLNRIIRGRHMWDPELHSTRIIEQIDKKTEIFQYVRRSINPLPKEEYCVLRTWKTDFLPKEACMLVETSVEHPDCVKIPNTVRGNVYASRYLIEPCGSGKSRIVHLSRVDTMGRSPEWYQKNYGHLCAFFIGNLQNSFSQNAIGPESKV